MPRLEQIERDDICQTRIHFDLPVTWEGIPGHFAADVITRHRQVFQGRKSIVSTVRRLWASDDGERVQFPPRLSTPCPVIDLTVPNPLPSMGEMDKQHRGYLALAVHPSRVGLLRSWVAGDDSSRIY